MKSDQGETLLSLCSPTVKLTLSMPNYAEGFSSASNLIKQKINISLSYFQSNIQPYWCRSDAAPTDRLMCSLVNPY